MLVCHCAAGGGRLAHRDHAPATLWSEPVRRQIVRPKVAALLRIIDTMYRILCSLSLLGLLACSPALNWRHVSLPEVGLDASLPCKPEHLERQIELAGHPAQVRMAGCSADGVTFAVSCAALQEPAQAGMALTHWRAAVLAALQAPAAQQPGAPQDQPFVPAGALAIPQSVRTAAQGQQPGGGSVALQAVWFARVQGPNVHACHAVVYGAQLSPQVADTFFAGLVLQ